MSLENYINKVTPADFPMDRDHYVTTYTDLLIKNAPEHIKFETHKLFQSLKLGKEENLRFNELEKMITKKLFDHGIVYSHNYQYHLILTDLGIEVKNAGGLSNYIKALDTTANKEKYIITHNYNGVGQINQDSTFINSLNNINTVQKPTQKDDKSFLSKLWKFTDHKVVSAIILFLLSLLYGLYKFFG